MAWEWSHTNEAYAAAEQNTRALPRRTLLIILREWAYQDRETAGGSPHQGSIGPSGRVRGFRLPAGLRRLPTDVLADLVWQRAEEYRTCSNRGFDAYLCPDGCHTVPFHSTEETE